MDYKISDICSNLGIGKSTIYNRINCLKKNIPKSDWKNNLYFYYDDKNKLFITEKGYDYIKNFVSSSRSNSINSNSNNELLYGTIIEDYKNRIAFLENENKRLLDIITLKEQKELRLSDFNAFNPITKVDSSEHNNKFSFFSFFKNFWK